MEWLLHQRLRYKWVPCSCCWYLLRGCRVVSGLVLAIHLKRPYAFDKKNKSTCMGEEIMMMWFVITTITICISSTALGSSSTRTALRIQYLNVWLRRRFELEKPSGHQHHQHHQQEDVDVDCCSYWGVIFCCVLLSYLSSFPPIAFNPIRSWRCLTTPSRTIFLT